MKESSHSAVRPAKRTQGGEGRLYALVASEAALAGALAAVFLPGRLCAAAPLVALAFLAPAWRLRFPGGRRTAFYAPDPLSPNFKVLAAEVARRLEQAAFGDDVPPLVLSPFCDANGRFVGYSLDWRPEKSAVVVESPAMTTRRRTTASVRLRGVFPVEVQSYPVTLRFAHDPDRARAALLWQDVPVVRPRRESFAPPAAASILLRLYWTALAGLYAVNPAALKVSALLFLAALPPIVSRVRPFLPRLWRGALRQLAFLVRLIRRLVRNFAPVPAFIDKAIAWLEK